MNKPANTPARNTKVMNRFDLTSRLIAKLKQEEAVIGGIGNTNFDLWAAGHRPQNFYMLGSMGLALPIALGVALAAGNGVGTSWARLNLAWVANQEGRHDEADDLLAENLSFVRGLGQIRCEGFTLAFMADTSVRRGRLPDCAAPALLGATRALQIGDKYLAAWCLDLFVAAVAVAGDHQRLHQPLGADRLGE